MRTTKISNNLWKLVEAFGVGVDTAAEILIVAGDNPERIKSEAAFAKLAGVSPVSTGSGTTCGKHRINQGGHRQLNAAIHHTVTVRMQHHEPTKAYVARCTVENKSKRDIVRCLKRYVIREIYHLAKANPERAKSAFDKYKYRSINALAETVIGLFKTEIIRRLSPLTQRQIDGVARKLNERPRKILGFRSPAEQMPLLLQTV